MINNFCKTPLWKCARELSKAAAGIIPADTVITGAKLVSVCTKEIIENTDIAIYGGRIALVGDAKHCIGENTKVVEAGGRYAAPGFLDGHIHIESSMMTVSQYAKAVVPHGTVGVYMDPHEICNVLGLDGVRLMSEESKTTPLKTMITIPSCVPAVSGFEDTGAAVTAEDVAETMKWDNVVGLGEMMNFPGILSGEGGSCDIVSETLKAGKTATGHYSIPETGSGLNAYIAGGMRCCHESTRAEDALEKMRRGMYAQLREGSAWRDLHEVIKAITEHKADSRFANLISDDAHPETLIKSGHLDHIIRRAIEEGLDPITAIQMVTINTAQCFRMDDELGSIAPGKCADIVLIDELEKCSVSKVWIDGEVVAENGKIIDTVSHYTYPDWAKDTVHLAMPITADSFKIKTDSTEDTTVRVIEIIPARVGTYERHITMTPVNGELVSDTEQDILKTFVFERHHNTGTFGMGFCKGFGIKCGAMAATVAHDAHNLLVVGTNDEDMALAANTLLECHGGLCVVRDGKILGLVDLPVAGIMSEEPLERVAEKVNNLEKSWSEIGCDMVSPFMTMALIPLACLPELRLTNRGLVDCTKFEFVPLEVK